MKPEISITESSLIALNPAGKKTLKALAKILKATAPADIVEIGNLVEKKPHAIKEALKFKAFI